MPNPAAAGEISVLIDAAQREVEALRIELDRADAELPGQVEARLQFVSAWFSTVNPDDEAHRIGFVHDNSARFADQHDLSP